MTTTTEVFDHRLYNLCREFYAVGRNIVELIQIQNITNTQVNTIYSAVKSELTAQGVFVPNSYHTTILNNLSQL
jgi:hypothetical protein